MITDDYEMSDCIAAIPWKSERIVYRVQYNAIAGRWAIRRSGELQDFRKLRIAAIFRGAALARAEHRRGRLAQLVVHDKRGRIRFERTYGADPRRTKG